MKPGISLGPFVLSLGTVMVAVALAVAVVAGAIASRGRRIGLTDALFEMLLAGAIVARVAFVAQWFEQYRASPWTMLDIRDGGFTLPAGIGAALLLATWKARRNALLRAPLAIAVACGGLAWALLAALPQPGGAHSTPLPSTALRALDGSTATLPAIASGHPTVVNLWATWCPPCRRELPALAAAQQHEPNVHFVFADQAEDAATVQRFVERNVPSLANVLLDENGELGKELGAPGLPTTFFFDSAGKLVDTHVGQLSEATLAEKISRMRTSGAAQRPRPAR